LIGLVEVYSSGTWEVPRIGSRKARTLLALLGAYGGRMVTVDRAVQALWNGTAPQQPEANVATLVSRLRARFGPDMIIGGHGGYRLGSAIGIDLYDAATLVATAERGLRGGQPALSLQAAERAVRLLDGGPAMADYPNSDWVDQARATQDALLRRARHAAGESALDTAAPARAQLLAESAIAADPLDEAAYRVLMRACVATGEPARAMLAYQRLRTTLAAELGVDPTTTTQDLHLSILHTNTAAG
jgi:DNA-binding SARP family transcriptional activator